VQKKRRPLDCKAQLQSAQRNEINSTRNRTANAFSPVCVIRICLLSPPQLSSLLVAKISAPFVFDAFAVKWKVEDCERARLC
jgi:hypothetical protein